MPDDLSEMFEEAMSEDLAAADEGIDNLDDQADDTELVDDDGDEEIVGEDDAPADQDDEPPAEEAVEADDDFDWKGILERYGDRTVSLTVNGEIVEKPLKELPGMAMMREDYSRKTAAVAEKERDAQWAADVKAAFERDPYGTLDAFARAYGLDAAPPASAQPEVDPYEDMDPDVAAVLRRLDEQEARHQQEMEAVRQQQEAIAQRDLRASVKAEVEGLRDEFGEDLDVTEMLRMAASYNMPLRDAAQAIMGQKYYSMSKEQRQLADQATQAGEAKAATTRQAQKRRASGTGTKKFNASEVSVEDFSDIGELLQIEMNSIS